jgi:hypothetical protein
LIVDFAELGIETALSSIQKLIPDKNNQIKTFLESITNIINNNSNNN